MQHAWLNLNLRRFIDVCLRDPTTINEGSAQFQFKVCSLPSVHFPLVFLVNYKQLSSYRAFDVVDYIGKYVNKKRLCLWTYEQEKM